MSKTTGQFFVAKVNGRRHLVFQRATGEVGASPSFRQDEAVANARKVDVPDIDDVEKMFGNILKRRGFIVTRSEVILSDNLGAAIEREVKITQSLQPESKS